MAKDPSFDWSQFRLGIYVRVEPGALYDLWTTSDGLTRWFLRSSAFAPTSGPPANRREAAKVPAFEDLPVRRSEERCQANDRYCWEWHYNGGIVGEDWVLECRPPTKLVFGFGKGMKVEVLIRKQGTYSEVNLRQFNIPVSRAARYGIHMGSRVAWCFFLTNLKSVAEGGLDLRETERSKTRKLHLVNM